MCVIPVSEFERIDLAITWLLAGRIVISQYESAAVTPPVNLRFLFLSRVSRHLIEFIVMDS